MPPSHLVVGCRGGVQSQLYTQQRLQWFQKLSQGSLSLVGLVSLQVTCPQSTPLLQGVRHARMKRLHLHHSRQHAQVATAMVG